MTHLPDSDLRELEGLLGKATPGPWRCISTQVYSETFIGQAMTPMDAALIVAMHSALPSLIADLREARERIDAMSAVGIRQETELAQARARIEELEGKT